MNVQRTRCTARFLPLFSVQAGARCHKSSFPAPGGDCSVQIIKLRIQESYLYVDVAYDERIVRKLGGSTADVRERNGQDEEKVVGRKNATS